MFLKMELDRLAESELNSTELMRAEEQDLMKATDFVKVELANLVLNQRVLVTERKEEFVKSDPVLESESEPAESSAHLDSVRAFDFDYY